MGMDFTIYSARNREIFKHDGWWNSDQVQEEFYSRKAWYLVDNCAFIPKIEDECPIEVTEENLEEMIKVACHNRNYWDNYNDVPKLCELRDKFDQLEEEKRKLYIMYG